LSANAIFGGVLGWDGKTLRRGPELFKISVRSEAAAERILGGGTLAFGEEYAAGNIDIAGDLQKMASMYDQWQAVAGQLSVGTKARILWNHFFSRGTVSGSKKNIGLHYDIGNDFYSLWLDPTMTYSCAYFKSDSDSLETAQNNKYEHICRKLQLKSGESLVDIGCGWGGMMFYAAKNYGAVCTGYTLSKNQYDYIVKRVGREGLGARVSVYLQDYRKAEGSFDKFVSIGMFEHVGKRYQKKFFEMAKRILKPQGIGVLHTIGSIAGGATDPWIAKYIFPGGYVPTLALVAGNMSKAGLVFSDLEDLRMHYARTLDLWIRNFEGNIAPVKKTMAAQLRDERGAEQFIRMWRLYLNASAVSFKTAGNRLYQIIFTNGVDNNLPLTRDYIYNR
jgi:cyclopropane-fatty-acyl-phospholipid synthase